MEEEKDKQSQGISEQIEQKIDSTKNKTKKIKKIIEFLKKHPLIAKMLFWVCLAIAIIIIFVSIIYVIKDDDMPSESLELTKQAMQSINISGGEGRFRN